MSLKDMERGGTYRSTAEQYPGEVMVLKYLRIKFSFPQEKVHPLALAVGEDQERNMIVASDKATKVILPIFQNDKKFKKYGGKVAVIGKVLKKDHFIMKDSKTVYCDIPVSLITGAPVYKPFSKKPSFKAKEREFQVPPPQSLKKEILKVIASKNVYSKADVFGILKDKKKDYMVMAPDETDVCVIAPLKTEKTSARNKRIGVALVFGGKSIHGRNGSAEIQAYLATVLARLKLAVAALNLWLPRTGAITAIPITLNTISV